MALSRNHCCKVNTTMHFLRVLNKCYRQQYENFECYVTMLLWRVYLGINVSAPRKFLSDFNQTGILSTDSHEIRGIKFRGKICAEGVALIHAGWRTDVWQNKWALFATREENVTGKVSAVLFCMFKSVVSKRFRVSSQIAHSGTANSSSYKPPTANRFP